MFNEIVGREVVKYEVFEPWCMSPDAKIDGIPVFGALALHTQDTVLTLSSHLRFSSLAKGARTSFGLKVSVMPKDAWALKRSWWIAHSASMGVRPLRWYSNPMQKSEETPYLPVSFRRKITAISIHPHDLDAVSVSFDGHSTPVTFEYRDGFDGGIAWVGPKLSAPSIISPFLPMGEFSWLHPASKFEIRHPHGLLKSAVSEDWPLALRRAVLGHQEAGNGEPLRSGAQLLGMSQLRSVYLDAVANLMQLLFAQHPALARRLAVMSARVESGHDYGAMINERSSRWVLQTEMTV